MKVDVARLTSLTEAIFSLGEATRQVQSAASQLIDAGQGTQGRQVFKLVEQLTLQADEARRLQSVWLAQLKTEMR